MYATDTEAAMAGERGAEAEVGPGSGIEQAVYECGGDPVRLAALLTARPHERATILAYVQMVYGNAMVAEALASLPPPAADAPAAAPARIEVPEPGAAPEAIVDVATAEAHNRSHVSDVVRFDFATRGRFAKGNGELDVVKIIAFQREHHLAETGIVDENTCLVAEGKPPLPAPAKPFLGTPAVELLHPQPGAMFPPNRPLPLTLRVVGPAVIFIPPPALLDLAFLQVAVTSRLGAAPLVVVPVVLRDPLHPER